jgi:hypothetical protein
MGSIQKKIEQNSLHRVLDVIYSQSCINNDIRR